MNHQAPKLLPTLVALWPGDENNKVVVRITATNRIYCVYKGLTAFPYIAGSSELKYDVSDFVLPEGATAQLKKLLMKQIQVRMSPGYRRDLEDEQNKELWQFTDEV
jgi:hypothetical protein